MSSGQPDGIGYAEQEEAVRALSQHYTAGRLDVDEFDERVRRARASASGSELAVVFADLPEPRPPAAGPEPPGSPGPDAPTRRTEADPVAPGRPATHDGAVPASGDPAPGGPGAGGPGAGGPAVPGTAEETVATPQYPGAPYPGAQYPTAAYPTAQYPGAQYPTAQYPTAQYPGAPYPDGYDQYAAQQYGGPQYGAGQYGSGQYGPGQHPGQYGAPYPPPGAPYGLAPGGYDPAAPYGWDPVTGRPYSDKQKIVAGLLQIFLPFGVGRFYTGHVGMGVAQLLVTFFTLGFGAIWPFIDGIVLLAGSPTDPGGRPLRS